jgi:hypothetical protein
MKVFFVCIGGLVVLAAISWLRHVLGLRRHAGWRRDDFIANFSSASIAPAVSGAVYDHFQQMGIWRKFTPAPFDRLDTTYKMIDEDATDNLAEILRSLGLEMPDSAAIREWESPVETLSDVVVWVNWAATQKPNEGL